MYTILQLMEMLIFENWHYFILKHANELQNLVDRKQSSDISLPVTLQTGYRSRQGRILACANWGPSIDQSWGLIQPPALVGADSAPSFGRWRAHAPADHICEKQSALDIGARGRSFY